MTPSGYRDYFKLLGVDRSANLDSIKQAFRTLARKYHPDVNPGDSDAEEKFKEISEAYEVLSDPEKRRRYEQFGQYWNNSEDMRGGATQGAAFDVDFGRYGNFDDFINDLLGKFGGTTNAGGFPKGSNRVSINLDAEVKVKISFSEAFNGAQRILSVNNERVQVRIPEGVKSGSRLRLKGKGNIQPGMGRRGDLYLNLQVESHPVWKLDGDLLRADLPVSFDELALGSEVSVITPDGETQLTIPPGTSPGRSLRLKGKGWPSAEGRGDLIFTLVIQLPKEWSSKELSLLKELQGVRSVQPREKWIISAHL